MIYIHYNSEEKECVKEVLDLLLVTNEVAIDEAGTKFHIYTEENEYAQTKELLLDFGKALTENKLRGVFITKKPALHLLTLNTILGVNTTEDIKKLCLEDGLWTNLGILPCADSLLDLYRWSPLPKQNIGHISRHYYLEQLQEFTDSENEKTCYIYGPSGQGKTRLIKDFCSDKQIFYHGFKDSTRAEIDWWKLFVNDAPINSTSISAEQVLLSILNYFKEIKTQRLIVFDDIQWANPYSIRIITALRKSISFPHKVIILCREKEPSAEEGDNTRYLKIKDFSDAEIEEIITSSSPQLTKAEIKHQHKFISKLSNGHPLLTHELYKHFQHSPIDDELNSHSNVLATIYFIVRKNTLIDIPLDSETFKLLRILAEIKGDLKINHLVEIKNKLTPKADFDQISALSIVNIEQGKISYSHELYRQAIQNSTSLDDQLHLFQALATLLGRQKNHVLARHFWLISNKKHRALVSKIRAFHTFYENSNTSASLELAHDLIEESDEYQLSTEKQNLLLWRVANTIHAAGILEEAVRYYRRFLSNKGFVARRRHIFLMLFYYFFPKHQFKHSVALSDDSYDRCSTAVMRIIDFLAFQNNQLQILKTVTLSHQINLYSSKKSAYKGFTYLYIALYFFPFVKEKLTKRFIKHAEDAISGSDGNREDFNFLLHHYNMNLENWDQEGPKTEVSITNAKNNHDYLVVARHYMLKALNLLDTGALHQYLTFVEQEVESTQKYLPEWFQYWHNQLRYSVYLEVFHPSKLIFIKQDKIPVEILAGANLFFAHAETSLGNYDKAKEHLEVVLKHFSQMQYLNQAFTLCIKSFIEVPIILFFNGYISKRIFKKFMRCARHHGNVVYRSKPLINGYKAITEIRSSNSKKGNALLEMACQESIIRGNYSANRLFRLHILYLYGAKVDLYPAPYTGELMRVVAMWKGSDHQAHPNFLSIL